MQRIPGQGPRNPNGHSAEEVRRAIQAVNGSQRITFRFELCNRNNARLRSMDEVEEGTGRITLNNLGDVKRVLSGLRLRSGTPIDWGSDRIRPYARVHLPPYGDDDWVDLPQGVFLPVSPSQTADTTGTVWRDIEGMDQGVILADDQLPTRYATAGHVDARDAFLRDQTGSWGPLDIGGTWSQSNINGTVYGVTTEGGGYAYATLTASHSLVRLSTPPRRYRDGEVLTRVAVDQLATGEAMIPSVILRHQPSGAYYRVRLHFQTSGEVAIAVTNGTTQVGSSESTGATYTPGRWICLRARIIGQDVMGRAWADGTPEPSGWQVERTITTATLGEGHFGLAASVFGNNTNVNPQLRFASFALDANPSNLVTGHVRRVLEQGGITQHSITPSGEVLPADRDWEPGTSRATIVADLLASINYRSLSFDEDGVAIAAPYVSPSERAPEWEYLDGSTSIMELGATQELDLYAVPNRWSLTVSEPDREALTVTFTNTDPASPTSVPRRGRVITDNRQDQDATSEAALVEQVARIAYESSQVYEAVEITTGLNPLHSGDDVFRVRRDDLAVDTTYASHTWEMDLSPTGGMRHRARRLIALTAASDPSIVVGDVTVSGALAAGNIRTGTVSVSPVPNTPTVVSVTGLGLTGTGPVRVQLTPVTAVPGVTLREVAVRNPTPDGFQLWLYRSNATRTDVQFLAIRGA